MLRGKERLFYHYNNATFNLNTDTALQSVDTIFIKFCTLDDRSLPSSELTDLGSPAMHDAYFAVVMVSHCYNAVLGDNDCILEYFPHQRTPFVALYSGAYSLVSQCVDGKKSLILRNINLESRGGQETPARYTLVASQFAFSCRDKASKSLGAPSRYGLRYLPDCHCKFLLM